MWRLPSGCQPFQHGHPWANHNSGSVRPLISRIFFFLRERWVASCNCVLSATLCTVLCPAVSSSLTPPPPPPPLLTAIVSPVLSLRAVNPIWLACFRTASPCLNVIILSLTCLVIFLPFPVAVWYTLTYFQPQVLLSLSMSLWPACGCGEGGRGEWWNNTEPPAQSTQALAFTLQAGGCIPKVKPDTCCSEAKSSRWKTHTVQQLAGVLLFKLLRTNCLCVKQPIAYAHTQMHDKNYMTLVTHVQADLTLSDTPIKVKEVLQDRRVSFTVGAAHTEATLAPFDWKETQVLKYVTTRSKV